MPITSFYAALLALLFVVLSVRTLRLRRRLGIAVGDDGSAAMLRAMRVHANFAEYVPLCLLLSALAEAAGAPAMALHAGLAALLAGRAVHAYGVGQVREDFRFRVVGVGVTLTFLVVAAGYLVFASGRVAFG